MSYASYLIHINEQELFINNTAIDEADEFGEIKIDKPSSEGLDAAMSSADQFSDSSDGEDTDVDLSFHDSFPEDDSGFEQESQLFIGDIGPATDVNTIPAVNAEDDQFTDPEELIDDMEDADDEPIELASDDAIDSVEESATGWDDLF